MIGFFATVRLRADNCHARQDEGMFRRCISIVAAAASAVGCAYPRAITDNVALVHADFVCTIIITITRSLVMR